jgi:hypothetical protein
VVRRAFVVMTAERRAKITLVSAARKDMQCMMACIPAGACCNDCTPHAEKRANIFEDTQ